MRLRQFSLGVSLLLVATSVPAYGRSDDSRDLKILEYMPGDRIEVSCLNRSIETGEHIEDEKTGALQYVPFATCNETGLPLSFDFHRDSPQGAGVNCTIPFLSDEMFHLLEFYIHHDSPLACRVPARPLDGDFELAKVGAGGISENGAYVPLVFSISGKLEFSHLHIANQMNIIFHLSSPGALDSATAYSTSSLTHATRIIIGDPLPLYFNVRWYDTTALPSMNSTIGDEESLFWFICIIFVITGILAFAATVLWKRKSKGRGMDGIIGNGYNGGSTGNGNGSYAKGGYGEGYGGYGGFKGVAVRGGDSGSNSGYKYGVFSGKRKD